MYMLIQLVIGFGLIIFGFLNAKEPHLNSYLFGIGTGLVIGVFLQLTYTQVSNGIKERKKKKKPTACDSAQMVPDVVRGGYKCDICDFPNSPCPNK